ncbi:MAG: glycosyltransferase family 2 protein [Patescibacteria group bacterium]
MNWTSDHKQYYNYRILEIIPGFLVWLTFIGCILLALLNPIWGIYLIIAFDIYWVLRILYMMLFLLISWSKYRRAIKIDWWSKLQTDYPQWSEYYHLIFLPTAGEPLEIVDNTFHNLSQIKYNTKKMIIILAGEGRYQDHFMPIAQSIVEKYQQYFHKIIITVHPDNIPGEVKGKGSNLYHAGHEVKRYVDENKLDYKKLIVSSFDIDTVTHPDYFSFLTYKFISTPDPHHASFQPMAFYNNNVWESDIITRVVANSTTFWLMTDLARPSRLFTFSSHSMSWQALVDIGFWQNNIVTEDSRIFLQCLIHYDGNYRVEPMHIPVSMNTVYVGDLWRSLKNQYKQMRRWAYGVEHFPYMVWHFRKSKSIPTSVKVRYTWNQTEGVYSWATAPVIITIMGWLPLKMAEHLSLTTVVAQNAPLLLEGLMRFGMIGILAVATMGVVILPPMPVQLKNNKLAKYYRYPLMFLQWIIIPFTMIAFGSIPAIDAQTRLMMGKYLGFWVTEKKKVQI